ncbi:MAG: hypothetical protein JO256_00900 [Alphaproteobacteria bacterium]|nr:hypothetical protein [Alphaproteobacteria bacterium]
MPDQNDQPEFDPATWTPSKPWPKGYCKPNIDPDDPDYRFSPSQYYRRRNGIPLGPPGEYATAFRLANWLLVACLFQMLGFAYIRASGHSGFAHAVSSNITPWPIFALLALAVPTWFFARFVWTPDTPTLRRTLYGLGLSLVLLLLLNFILGSPIPTLGLVYPVVKARLSI